MDLHNVGFIHRYTKPYALCTDCECDLHFRTCGFQCNYVDLKD